MERYKLIKEVGDGTFGSVWRAINKQSGEVAIKKMKKKYYSWEECVNLTEVKSLRRMNHPNIVKLKEVIRENDILYFVFEYMECNLYQLIKDKEKLFPESEVRNWCFQVFQGLAYMHQRGYFHRDLKPGIEPLKCSFSLTFIALKLICGQWEQSWLSCSLSVLFFLVLADEIYKICNVIGSPTEDSWPDGLGLARAINYQFPQFPGINLSVLMPSVSGDGRNLIQSLCSWDPCKRPTAAEALQHPFFQLEQKVHWSNSLVCNANWIWLLRRLTSHRRALPNLSDINHQEGKAHGRTLRGVPDTASKFSGTAMASRRQQLIAQPRPPPMKAGVQWSAQSGDMFLRPSQQFQAGRSYPRK
ncbi:hypothetical protein Tsubulata_006620, partial [Turnera subulata]